MTKTRYEFWQHKTDRRIYAVRLAGARVTGLFGPLTASGRADRLALPHFSYEEHPERIQWLQEREWEFLLVG